MTTAQKIISIAILLTIIFCGCANPVNQSGNKNPEVSADLPDQTSTIHRDPIEDDPKYRTVFRNIDGEVKNILEDDPRQGDLGYCHHYWDTKKKLLKEKYDIEWKTPAEMNPHIFFD